MAKIYSYRVPMIPTTWECEDTSGKILTWQTNSKGLFRI